MPNSVLGTNLVDSLVPVVDDLRTSLYADMGVRQYAVHVVRRSWSGTRRMDGSPTVTSDLTLTPPPLVEFPSADGMRWEMQPAGRDQTGKVRLSEISLTYTEAELTGGSLSPTEDFYYELRDAQGQSIPNRRYVIDMPPRADREKGIGWVLELRKAEVP